MKDKDGFDVFTADHWAVFCIGIIVGAVGMALMQVLS